MRYLLIVILVAVIAILLSMCLGMFEPPDSDADLRKDFGDLDKSQVTEELSSERTPNGTPIDSGAR